MPLKHKVISSASDVRVYSSHGAAHESPSTWREMICELLDSRELTCRLFLRDFSVRYRQSMLGYVWAIVPVLATAGTFTWLTHSRIVTVGDTALPYPVFVLLSMTVWQLFASGLIGATQSLVSAGALLAKINFPRETLVLAAFGQSLFEFAIRSVLVCAAMALYHSTPSRTIALIPLALLPLCLFTLGVGFLTALLNGLLRDVGQMITVLLTFWMFITPVVYPAPAGGNEMLSALNPVAPFVIAAQDLANRGRLAHPASYLLSCFISLIVFLIGWRVFHLSEAYVAERA